MRIALALCLVVLAATPAAAVSLGTISPPPDTTEVDAAIERGRLALLAENYTDASKALDEALQKESFLQLPKSDQFRAVLFASLAARGREDYLAAHEFMAIATGYPDAKAEHWVMRAQMASWVDAWADAGLSIKTVASKWPAALPDIGNETIQWVALQMSHDKKLTAERLEMVNALFAARFLLDWHTEPSEMWRELLLDALDRKDLAHAREVIKRIDDPASLVRMRIDRRFDAIVKAEPKSFDVVAAAHAQAKRLHHEVETNPRKLGPVVRYMYALFDLGSYDEVVSLADRVLAKNANAPKDKPVYDDLADTINWIYDLKSQGLRGLGRWDEALVIQEEARRQRENSNDKVSQAINLGYSYYLRDRPQDALKSLEGIDWAHSLSPYGRMQLQHVRLNAYLQIGDRTEAEKVFVYMRENKMDAPDNWQEAMLDWGDVDGAAALYIARLRDPEQRTEALYGAQFFRPIPRLPREAAGMARWQELLKRPDVAAAIAEVGRREQQQIYDLWN